MPLICAAGQCVTLAVRSVFEQLLDAYMSDQTHHLPPALHCPACDYHLHGLPMAHVASASGVGTALAKCPECGRAVLDSDLRSFKNRKAIIERLERWGRCAPVITIALGAALSLIAWLVGGGPLASAATAARSGVPWWYGTGPLEWWEILIPFAGSVLIAYLPRAIASVGIRTVRRDAERPCWRAVWIAAEAWMLAASWVMLAAPVAAIALTAFLALDTQSNQLHSIIGIVAFAASLTACWDLAAMIGIIMSIRGYRRSLALRSEGEMAVFFGALAMLGVVVGWTLGCFLTAIATSRGADMFGLNTAW